MARAVTDGQGVGRVPGAGRLHECALPLPTTRIRTIEESAAPGRRF